MANMNAILYAIMHCTSHIKYNYVISPPEYMLNKNN